MARQLKRNGFIILPILLLLLLLSLGASHITSQQIELSRINQWQDVALRVSYRVDQVLAQVTQRPYAFSQGESAWEGVNHWPKAVLATWRSYPRVMPIREMDGIEVYVILEASHQTEDLFRFNALGYHPSGTMYRKQWVLKCEEKRCRRLSQRLI